MNQNKRQVDLINKDDKKNYLIKKFIYKKKLKNNLIK